jgi:hypothetical protein
MKKLHDLSKQELISLILNVLQIGVAEESIECAGCGKTSKAKFYYVCDECSK